MLIHKYQDPKDLEPGKLYKLYNPRSAAYGERAVRLFRTPESISTPVGVNGYYDSQYGPLIQDTEIVMYLAGEPTNHGRNIWLRILWDNQVWLLPYDCIGEKVENI